jgi:hypothetical protein
MAKATVTIKVVSTAATGVEVDGQSNLNKTLSGAQAGGTVVGTITVDPADWNGELSLSGADAALFSLAVDSGGHNQLVAGSGGLPIRTAPYAVEVDADP